MENAINLSDILCQSIKYISKRVADLDLTLIHSADMDSSNVSSLIIITSGDYQLTLSLYTENSVLEEITKRMKHQDTISPEDIPIYTIEYYNIFCGHVVSEINHVLHTSARFKIPLFINGLYLEDSHKQANDFVELFFKSAYGVLNLKVTYACSVSAQMVNQRT